MKFGGSQVTVWDNAEIYMGGGGGGIIYILTIAEIPWFLMTLRYKSPTVTLINKNVPWLLLSQMMCWFGSLITKRMCVRWNCLCPQLSIMTSEHVQTDDIAACILNLGTRMRWVISFLSQPHEVFSCSVYSRQVGSRNCGLLHEDYITVMAYEGIAISGWYECYVTYVCVHNI